MSLAVNMGSPAAANMNLEEINRVVPALRGEVTKIILDELARNGQRNRLNCLAGGVAILSIGSAIIASISSYKTLKLESLVNNLYTKVEALENQDCSLVKSEGELKVKECQKEQFFWQRELDKSKTHNNEIGAETIKCKKELEVSKNNHGKLSAEFQSKLQAAEQALNECKSKNEKCQEDLKDCNSINEKSEKEISKLEGDINSLTNKNGEIDQKLTACRQDNREFYDNTNKAVANTDRCTTALTQCAKKLAVCEKLKPKH